MLAGYQPCVKQRCVMAQTVVDVVMRIAQTAAFLLVLEVGSIAFLRGGGVAGRRAFSSRVGAAAIA